VLAGIKEKIQSRLEEHLTNAARLCPRVSSMNLQTFDAAKNSANGLGALAPLLRQLIDYAGLFPPASLSMAQSLANYATYSRSEWNWILGRFIVPMGRLEEFEEAFAELPFSSDEIGSIQCRLSVLVGNEIARDIARISEFNGRMASISSGRMAAIETVEVKIGSPAEVPRLSAIIPSELETYFELPLSNGRDCILAIADCARRAKIRTGGETADKFPTSDSVIEFIRLCAAANVPFKATAGLHHPIRSAHRFTYDPESPSGMMHGFLNLFLAAAFLRAGMETKLAVQLFEEESARNFKFDFDGITWREHRLNPSEIAAARASFAVSFGSCSFSEPIDDLRSLHFL
jgi:hypothetical protein